MGATFDNVECLLKGQNGDGLTLSKRASKVTEGSLFLITGAAMDATSKKRAEGKKDI